MNNRKEIKTLLEGWNKFYTKKVLSEAFDPQVPRGAGSSGKEDMIADIPEDKKKLISAIIDKYFDFSSKTGTIEDISQEKKNLISSIMVKSGQEFDINLDNIFVGVPERAGISDENEYIPATMAPTSPERERAKGSSKKRGPAFSIYARTQAENPDYIVYDNDRSGLSQIKNGLNNARKLAASTSQEEVPDISLTTYLVTGDGQTREVDPSANDPMRKWNEFRVKVVKLIKKYARTGAKTTTAGYANVKNTLMSHISEFPLILGAFYDAINDPSSGAGGKRASFSDEEYSKIRSELADMPFTREQVGSLDQSNREEFINKVSATEKMLRKAEEYLSAGSEQKPSSKVYIFDFDGTLFNTMPVLQSNGINESWKFLSYLVFLKPDYKKIVYTKMSKGAEKQTNNIKLLSQKDQVGEYNPDNTYIVSNVQAATLRNEEGIQRPVTKFDFINWLARGDADIEAFISNFLGGKAEIDQVKKTSPAQPQPAATASTGGVGPVQGFAWRNSGANAETEERVQQQRDYYEVTEPDSVKRQKFNKWLEAYNKNMGKAIPPISPELQASNETAHPPYPSREDFRKNTNVAKAYKKWVYEKGNEDDQMGYEADREAALDDNDSYDLDEVKKVKSLKEQLAGLRFRLGTKK